MNSVIALAKLHGLRCITPLYVSTVYMMGTPVQNVWAPDSMRTKAVLTPLFQYQNDLYWADITTYQKIPGATYTDFRWVRVAAHGPIKDEVTTEHIDVLRVWSKTEAILP